MVPSDSRQVVGAYSRKIDLPNTTHRRMSLTHLPFAVLLEITTYLNVRTLVALADVNRALRALSRSYKTYWIPLVLEEDLLLPLAPFPLMSFSPSELASAAHKAIYREMNLSSNQTELHSFTRVSWPFAGVYPRTPTSEKGKAVLFPEIIGYPLKDFTNCHLHPNGEWYFMLSADCTLRILHLRTGTMALRENLNPAQNSLVSTAHIAYCVDFQGDFEARIAVSTPIMPDAHEDSRNTLSDRSILSIFVVKLDLSQKTANMTPLDWAPLKIMPKHMRLARTYAVIIAVKDSDNGWREEGPVHVIDWTTGKSMTLPPLLNSLEIAAFPRYFISLGYDIDRNLQLQVVSFPMPSETEVRINRDADTDSAEDYQFILAVSLAIDSGSDEFSLIALAGTTSIYHHYTGLTTNTVLLWLRDNDWDGSHHVFRISFDFSKSPENWYTPSVEAQQNEDGTPFNAFEHLMLREKEGVINHIIPGSNGSRFFWWKENISQISNEPTPHHSSTHAYARLLLFSSHTGVVGTPLDEGDDSRTDYPVREMESPICREIQLGVRSRWEQGYEDAIAVSSIVAAEWSGTVLITLTSGDMFVLRYGHD